MISKFERAFSSSLFAKLAPPPPNYCLRDPWTQQRTDRHRAQHPENQIESVIIAVAIADVHSPRSVRKQLGVRTPLAYAMHTLVNVRSDRWCRSRPHPVQEVGLGRIR